MVVHVELRAVQEKMRQKGCILLENVVRKGGSAINMT